MIGGKQCGPYELSQLADAGVGPDTYVWCKSMDDWKKAGEVADICRFFRQRLAGINTAAPTVQPSEQEFQRPMPQESGADPIVDYTDYSAEPRSFLAVSVLLTLLCFPITGFVAIYFSVMTRRLWAESKRGGRDADDYRRMAHDYSRQTRMWIGITFFIGVIFYAFMFRRLAS